MAEPEHGDLSTTHYLILALLFLAILPLIKGFEYCAENYLAAPPPWAEPRGDAARDAGAASPKGAGAASPKDVEIAFEDPVTPGAWSIKDGEASPAAWGRRRGAEDEAFSGVADAPALAEVAEAPACVVCCAQNGGSGSALAFLSEVFRAPAEDVPPAARESLGSAASVATLVPLDAEVTEAFAAPEGLGEWANALVEDMDARLARRADAPPLGPEPTVREVAAALAPRACEAVLARSRELRARAAACGDARVRALLMELDARLLAAWRHDARRRVFVAGAASKIAAKIRKAAKWRRALPADAGRGEREAHLVACMREELLSRQERLILETCGDRLASRPEAPEAPPSYRAYAAACAAVAAICAYMAYYLVTTGSQFGARKSRVWLEGCAFSIALYFAVVQPIVIYVTFVVLPSLVALVGRDLREPWARAAYPFAAPELLPDSAAFFLLQWQPDLRDTPAGASVLGARAARAASDSDGVRRAHAAAVRRPPLALRAAILASSCLFHLQDDVQDVVLEEMFCFMPLLTQPLIGFVPLPQSAGGKRGGLATALGLVLCLVVAAAVWNVYVRCRPETRVEPWRDDLEADGARDDDLEADGARGDDRGDRICPPTVVAPPH